MQPDETSKTGHRSQNTVETQNTWNALFQNAIKHVTVEPVGFMVLFSSFLQLVSMQVLGLEKACRVNLELDDEICHALRLQNQTMNISVYEKTVQEFFSKQLVWRSVLQTIFPCIMMIFLGGWSDTTGRRKAIMLFCICGEIAQCLNNIINVIFFSQITLEIYFFFDVLIIGIIGGPSAMFMVILNYICDITAEENRTYRVGFVSLCTFAGIPLGVALSGIVLNRGGYYTIFGISMFLHIVNFLYVVFMIFDKARTNEQRMYDGQGVVKFLKTFFNPAVIKDAFAMVWKKTENNRRRQLIILLLVASFLYGIFHGEHATLFLSTRYRFNWDEVQYSLYQTYSFIISTIGTVISLMVFSKYLKWHDTVLGITSTSSKILSSSLYCLAPTTSIFYLAPLADILSGAMVAMMTVRIMYSKLMTASELGKMTSLVTLVENLVPFIYIPIYTSIYTATMDTLPGAVYLFGAAATVPVLLAFIYLFRMHRVVLRKTQLAETYQLISRTHADELCRE